jgi:hypothetical protein
MAVAMTRVPKSELRRRWHRKTERRAHRDGLYAGFLERQRAQEQAAVERRKAVYRAQVEREREERAHQIVAGMRKPWHAACAASPQRSEGYPG